MAAEETIAQPLLEGRSLLILYGSENGHSQEIAEEMGDVGERLRFQVEVAQMDDVSLVSSNSLSFTQAQQLANKQTNTIETPGTPFPGCFCYLYNRPRGFSCQCHRLLEEPA